MAHLHFRCTTYKSGGSAASTRLEYITRQPAQELTASEQQIRYSQDDREDLVFSHSRNLPAWSGNNPHVFFRSAEKYEGVGWVAFEEWKVSLPHELTHDQHRALTEELVGAIAGTRLPITYAMHAPQTMSGSREQPHLHLILSRRQNDQHERAPEQHFRRWNATHPERGGAQKDGTFREWRHLWQQRVLISDVINRYMERAGFEERIDPRSLSAQGLERKPEPKLTPKESRQYREHGIVSKHIQQVLDIRASRDYLQERESAQAYWQERRAVFDRQERGIDTTEIRMTPEQRQQHLEHLMQREAHLTRTLTKIAETRQVLAYHEKAGRPTPPVVVERIERGFTEELILPTEVEERTSGRSGRMRIWNERRREEEERQAYERAR
jgi:hypothetical protein